MDCCNIQLCLNKKFASQRGVREQMAGVVQGPMQAEMSLASLGLWEPAQTTLSMQDASAGAALCSDRVCVQGMCKTQGAHAF